VLALPLCGKLFLDFRDLFGLPVVAHPILDPLVFDIAIGRWRRNSSYRSSIARGLSIDEGFCNRDEGRDRSMLDILLCAGPANA